MGAAKKLIDKKVLRGLVPINALSAPHLEEVSRKAVIEEIRANTYVFKKGDTDNQTIYLLEGKVELLDEKRVVVDSVRAGSEAALHPLAHKQPRQVGARAVGKVRVARIDTSLLDVLLTWDESAGYDVVEIDGKDRDDDDWMTRMLQSQAFLQLPPSNIHQLLMRLEAVSVEPGDVIVRQGDEGDYFYIVKTGRLAVTRKASANSQEVLLAELGEGACFGEEALVSGTRRNASVMMITAGTLMRLSKNDFNELLCAPLVHETDFEGARQMAAKGAQWLDVRLPGEFENQAIDSSFNIPLSALRERCTELDKDIDYIVCCDTGRRSAAGAFVLGQRGFKVYALKNGLMDVPEGVLAGLSPAKKTAAAKRAEVIPLENNTREVLSRAKQPDEGNREYAGDDASLIDRLAAAENDKHALRQHLARLQEQLQQAEQRTEAAKGRQTDSDKQRLHAAEQRKEELEADLKRLKETLSQIQQAAERREKDLRGELKQVMDRLETGRQHAEARSQELESELGRLRDEHGQLDKWAKTLVRERDEAAGAVQKLQQQLADLQDSVDRERSDNQQAQDGLRQTLGEREQALETLQTESGDLRQRLEAAEDSRRQLEERLSAVTEQSDQRQLRIDQLQVSLDEREQALQSRQADADSAGRHIEELQEQLGKVEQESGERQRQRDAAAGEVERLNRHVEELQAQLECTSGQLGAERDTLQQRVEQLQQESEALRQSTRQFEQQRDEANAHGAQLARQLEDTQRALAEQQQHSEAQRADAEQHLAEVQRQLTEQSGHEQALSGELQQRLEAAQAELEQVRQQLETAQRRTDEFEARTSELAREHESELTSAREAMGRAQTETENVQRENSRLLKRLEKAEYKRQNERQDHESELYRLRKQLKDAASESNAGLAAELEGMQIRLGEAEKLRDDVEVRLGERSAQLEEAQARVETLDGQLRQAQDFARQAEQQLLESSRAAKEEMAARIESEEQAQRALREELAALTDERNRNREELTVRTQELEDTRALLEAAQQQESEQETEQRQALTRAQQERDEALGRQQELQVEIEHLRAEGEVGQSVIDTQAASADAAVQREALEQAQRDTEAAQRERLVVEQRNVELQEEVEYLRAMVQTDTAAAESQLSGYDEDDSYALATPASNESDAITDEPPAAGYDVEHDGAAFEVLAVSESAPSDSGNEPERAPETAAVGETGGKRKTWLLVAVVMLALLAGAGVWWIQGQTTTGEAPVAEREVQLVAETTDGDEPQGAEDAQAAVAQESSQPAATDSGQSDAAEQIGQSQSGAEDAEAMVVSEQPAGIPNFSKGGSRLIKTSSEDPQSEQHAQPQSAQDSEAAKPAAQEAKADEKAAEAPASKQPLRSYSDRLGSGGRGPVMVELHGDSFLMGSGPSSANFDERPRHSVELKRFAISRYEVTFADYDRFANDTGRSKPSDKGWGRGNRPVINVSWKDARAYVKWLSKQTGSRYRLPTEAEWEFAARSGGTARYWWGNQAGKGNANCFDCASDVSGKTAPVGSFEASPFGIHDMAGNVMEWVQDCYVADYNSAPADGAAVTDGDCGRRVVRGGGYDSPSKKLRSAARDTRKKGTRLDNLGFRVVKER
ncbi:MAG: SUMF1/EgtB/PvdO family nonheme iron enzyme [Thiogranum sp.]